MDNAASGEVDCAGTKQEVARAGAEPPVGRPEPVDHDRVDKASEEEGEDEIGAELGAFSDGAAGDASHGYGESPLVEEVAVVVGGIRDVFESEIVGANEGVGGGARAKGKGEAKEVVGDAADNGVDHIGEHDVHGVLGSD